MQTETGQLVYVMGPSGAGKDSLLGYARERLAGQPLVFAHRYITRPATAGSENHVALSEAEFALREAHGCFALSWRRNGLAYGLGCEVTDWLAAGLVVVVNGSRAALPQARQRFPGLKPLWITASLPVLATRLAGRGRESADDIAARLAASAGFRPPADCRVLCNDRELAVAGDELVAWLSSHCHQPITAL